MKPRAITLTLAAADPNGICESQTPSGAGALTLDGVLVAGGVATMDAPRHLSIDSDNAADTTQVITITGTDRFGNVITEALTLNGTTAVVGTKNFATVTGATISAGTTGAIVVGTADEAESQWIPVNRFADFLTLVCRLVPANAVLTYAVQFTLTPLQTDGFQENDAVKVVHSTLTGETTNQDGTLQGPVTGIRLAVTGHTSGGVTLQLAQAAANG